MVPETALKLIRRWEGLRLNAYICPAGVVTIGYGHTGEVQMGEVWTKEQAEQYLILDAESAMLSAIQLCPVIETNSDRLSAITDFVFNLGAGRLKASTLRKRINDGQYTQVPDELRKWVWGGGKRLPGLVMRRQQEVDLWNERPSS